MNINFSFSRVDKNCKETLKKYLTESKINRLNRYLQHGNFELANLRVFAEYFTKNNAFLVKLELNIKKTILVAEERSHDILKGLDLALDRLISQLRKIESKTHDK